jgi:DNA-directed RNA polymerase III subunit RPC1
MWQIIVYLEEDWSADDCAIGIQLNRETISKLQLEVTDKNVAEAIVRQKKLKLDKGDVVLCKFDPGKHDLRVHVKPQGSNRLSGRGRSGHLPELFQRMEQLMRALPDIIIRGYPDAHRAVISSNKGKGHTILVEGYGLKSCMTTAGVKGLATKTNSIMEMRDVLGIEAARRSIIDEIAAVMKDMDIDPRHMQLLADVMTYKGEILGITRFGLSKMRDSVLQLASFEKTPDHLFDAAWNMKSDKIEGVSECIIMGQTMGVGTGAFKIVRDLGITGGELSNKPTVFENAWQELQARRNSRKGR